MRLSQILAVTSSRNPLDLSAFRHMAVRERVPLKLKGRIGAKLGGSEHEENLKASLAQASLCLEPSDSNFLHAHKCHTAVGFLSY